jgi:hypothetical protein
MRGWRSARSKSKAVEAARANAARAGEQPTWPPKAPATAPRLQYDGPFAPATAPLYGRWVETPNEIADAPPIEAPVEPAVAIPVDEPDAARVDVSVAVPDEPPAVGHIETYREPTEAPVTTLRLVPSTPSPAQPPAVAPQVDTQAEFLRLLEVVTSMCDHVIEYIEADRSERRMMIDTLTRLSRTITDGARATVAAASTPRPAPTGLFEARDRVVGGSMPAGPERDIDLRDPESQAEAQPQALLTEVEPLPGATSTEIAVEVRGRFGDRWVDGFEICEVMTTPDGPRYRLRRQRDGVVLPELFDATSIRHIETFEQLNGDPLNGPSGYWSRS